MPIRPGALPHSCNVTRRNADGSETTGASGLRARFDPELATEPEDEDELDVLVILGPEADGELDGGDRITWADRELDLELKGPPLPMYDGLGRLHHLEVTAQIAPGFPEEVGVYYLGPRSAGALDLNTAIFAPASEATFSTRARLRRAGAGGTDVLIGDDPAALTAWLLTTPFELDPDFAGINVEDRVIVLTSKTPELIGTNYRVTAVGNASRHKGRVFLVERID